MEIHSIISYTFESNTFVITTNSHAVIIDCGAPYEKIKAIVKDKKCAILLTHAHFDHIYHLKEYFAHLNCDIYMSQNAYEKLSNPMHNLSSIYNNQSVVVDNIEKEKVHFINDEIIQVGDIRVESIVTTGHSNCSRSFRIGDNLFVGDVLFNSGVGRSDFYDGNESELYQSIQKIKDMNQVMIYSGHGSNFRI